MNTIDTILERLSSFWNILSEIFAIPIFSIGSTSITFSLIFYFVFSGLLLLFFSRKLRNILVNRILKKYGLEYGTSKSVGTIFYYFLLIIGLFIIIQATGLDLTGLSLIAGALGVGIGFGLQNITNNFISGIIILFERPIKEGDRIEVGNVRGDVVKISARATTILTNDNISIIVPNSEFINASVINWSHNDRNVRFQYPVGVAYKEDPKFVRRLLLEVVSENHGVLKKPSPDVLFEDFGDSSLNFKLSVWTSDYIDKPMILKSQLYFAIFKKFRENKIEIPFPQRDLNLKSGFELPNQAPLDKG
jgi:small-conductance mechanosensitive channel